MPDQLLKASTSHDLRSRDCTVISHPFGAGTIYFKVPLNVEIVCFGLCHMYTRRSKGQDLVHKLDMGYEEEENIIFLGM